MPTINQLVRNPRRNPPAPRHTFARQPHPLPPTATTHPPTTSTTPYHHSTSSSPPPSTAKTTATTTHESETGKRREFGVTSLEASLWDVHRNGG